MTSNIDSIEKFYTDLICDPSLQEHFKVVDCYENFYQVALDTARELGYIFTLEELKASVQNRNRDTEFMQQEWML